MEDSETEGLDNKHSGTLCLGYCCLLMKVRMTASKRSFHQTLHVCTSCFTYTSSTIITKVLLFKYSLRFSYVFYTVKITDKYDYNYDFTENRFLKSCQSHTV